MNVKEKKAVKNYIRGLGECRRWSLVKQLFRCLVSWVMAGKGGRQASD